MQSRISILLQLPCVQVSAMGYEKDERIYIGDYNTRHFLLPPCCHSWLLELMFSRALQLLLCLLADWGSNNKCLSAVIMQAMTFTDVVHTWEGNTLLLIGQDGNHKEATYYTMRWGDSFQTSTDVGVRTFSFVPLGLLSIYTVGK